MTNEDLVKAIDSLVSVNFEHNKLLREQMKIQREMVDMQREIQVKAEKEYEELKNMLESAAQISSGLGRIKDIDPETFRDIAKAAKWQMDKQREEEEEFKRRIHHS